MQAGYHQQDSHQDSVRLSDTIIHAMVQLATSETNGQYKLMQVCVPVTWGLFQTIQGLQQLYTMTMWNVHGRVWVHVHVLMQRGIYERTLHIQLMNTHTMDSSNGKKHAYSGKLHDRSKIIRLVNTGNLFTTINNHSGLVPVNSAVLHLNLKDEWHLSRLWRPLG